MIHSIILGMCTIWFQSFFSGYLLLLNYSSEESTSFLVAIPNCCALPDGIYNVKYSVVVSAQRTEILEQSFIKIDQIKCKFQNCFQPLAIPQAVFACQKKWLILCLSVNCILKYSTPLTYSELKNNLLQVIVQNGQKKKVCPICDFQRILNLGSSPS